MVVKVQLCIHLDFFSRSPAKVKRRRNDNGFSNQSLEKDPMHANHFNTYFKYEWLWSIQRTFS